MRRTVCWSQSVSQQVSQYASQPYSYTHHNLTQNFFNFLKKIKQQIRQIPILLADVLVVYH